MQIYILAAIPVVLGAFLPPFIVLCIHWYNTLVAHLPKNVQIMLLGLTHTAVLAAEQSGAQGVIKKQQAEDTVHTALASLGFKIDPVYVDAAIEATVHALHNPAIMIPPVSVPPVEVVSSPVVDVPVVPIVGAQ